MQMFFKYCSPRTPHRYDEKTIHCTQHHYSLPSVINSVQLLRYPLHCYWI